MLSVSFRCIFGFIWDASLSTFGSSLPVFFSLGSKNATSSPCFHKALLPIVSFQKFKVFFCGALGANS